MLDRSKASFFAAGLLVGAAVVVLARFDGRPPAEAVPPAAGGDAVRPEPPPEPSSELPGPSPVDRSDPPDERPAERREEAREPLFSPALLAYADEGIRTGWQAVRSDEIPPAIHAQGMQLFDEQVLALPDALGRQLAERETMREEALADARTGGVFALLEHLDAGGTGPMLELVSDRSGFEGYFARGSTETFAEGVTRMKQKEPVEDGVTLTVPAGVFALEDFIRKWSHPEPFARDVTVAGAGMNQTLLVGGDFSSHSRVRNLRFRDCTIFVPLGYLLDLRSEPASVVLERVRVCGFDTGAGASCAVGTRALAIHFVDCEIVGGYGRHPQWGRIFDVRTDALLARFDRCTITAVSIGVGHVKPGATVVFSSCTLRDVLDDALTQAEQHPGVHFDACSFQRAPVLTSEELQVALRKDLNDLFLNWEVKLAR